jgi:hypothetical protein
MQALAPIPLTAEQMPQALPLVRVVAPQLDLETWVAFGAQRAATGAGGIVALRDGRGYFRGLYGYQIRHDLLDGAVLEIDLAITMDLAHRRDASAALTSEIGKLSRKLGCDGVHVRLRPDQRLLRRCFERQGYTLCAITLAAPLQPPR